MRLLFTSFTAIAVAIALAIFLKTSPGKLVFSYGDVTIQTSFAFFGVALVLLFVVMYFVVSITSGFIRLPKNYNRWKQHRNHRQSGKYLSRAFLLSLEGDWHKAEVAFRKGASASQKPMLNYLGAAKAAHQQGAIQRRDHYLRLAREYKTDSSLAVDLTQAELQLNQNQAEQAYAILEHLDEKGLGQNQAKVMLLDASIELKEWQKTLDLLADLEKKKIVPAENIKAKRLEAYAGMMKKAGETLDQSSLADIWNVVPKKLRSELYLIEVYVSEQLHFGGSSECELLLRQTLKRNWDPALIRLYGLVGGGDSTKQLAAAESMLKAHGHDPVLLLTLGRLSKRDCLWDDAKTYLQESIDVQPTAESYQELASLLEQQGDPGGATECYQKGLNLATGMNTLSSSNLLSDASFEEVIES